MASTSRANDKLDGKTPLHASNSTNSDGWQNLVDLEDHASHAHLPRPPTTTTHSLGSTFQPAFSFALAFHARMISDFKTLPLPERRVCTEEAVGLADARAMRNEHA